MIFSWNTHKLSAGQYAWSVYSYEYGVGQINRKAGMCPTRAQAIGRAKKWVLYFKRGGNPDNPPLVIR